MSTLRIGWAGTDLTPGRPVLITGQFHSRVSEGVMDPVTATAMALESGEPGQPDATRFVMVSCDLVAIPDGLRDAVRAHVRHAVPELPPRAVILNATHTHAGPEIRTEKDGAAIGGGMVTGWEGVDLGAMAPAEYVETISKRIADAVARAWAAREPAGMGFGLGHAVLSHNRRISYANGETRMYGKTDDPAFSHVEGYEDHSLNLMAFWNAGRRLTGIVVNVPCTAQVTEHIYEVSADYWHEAREELRRRLGKDLFILPQISAAGDQSPHIQIGLAAEERMWRLAGRTQRQDMAVRIADAVCAILPLAEKEIDWAPAAAHRVETVALTRRPLSEQDVSEARAEAERSRKQYETLRAELEAHPELKNRPRWYKDITHAYRRGTWYEAVVRRFEIQKTESTLPVEVHAGRLGAVAFATSPFEYYLDFGMQIKARSRAVQTFLIQHVGFGTYVPSLRATAGRSYGAVPASTPVGPEGGRELALWCVDAVNAFWPPA